MYSLLRVRKSVACSLCNNQLEGFVRGAQRRGGERAGGREVLEKVVGVL